jgi:enoyl-CoA hydratase
MADKTEPSVLVERHPGLMGLVLNRPRVLNTLNREMIRLLTLGLEEALAASDVGLVLISGAGERGFCAGGDLKELTRAVQTGLRITSPPKALIHGKYSRSSLYQRKRRS